MPWLLDNYNMESKQFHPLSKKGIVEFVKPMPKLFIMQLAKLVGIELNLNTGEETVIIEAEKTIYSADEESKE